MKRKKFDKYPVGTVFVWRGPITSKVKTVEIKINNTFLITVGGFYYCNFELFSDNAGDVCEFEPFDKFLEVANSYTQKLFEVLE